MKQGQYLISTTLVLFGLVGCGPKPSNGDQDLRGRTLTRHPIELTKQDSRCVGKYSLGDQIQITLNLFMDEKVGATDIRFDHQIRENYVVSNGDLPIKQTIFNTKMSYTESAFYDKGQDDYNLVDTSELILGSKGEDLTICPQTKTYDTFTYEAIALSISNSITQTHAEITKNISPTKIPAISLNIAPEIKVIRSYLGGENNGVKLNYYESDNAYYDPSTQVIAFLPMSKTYQSYHSEVALWQVPMVASHEYGHHVYNSLTSLSKKTSLNCFNNRSNITALSLSNVVKKHDTSAKFAYDSINEGFADLISYYTLKESKKSVNGVACFTHNRDIGSNTFGDKTSSKKFTQSARQLIRSSKVEKKYTDCNTPNYQEVHDVGAIFAYNANYILALEFKQESERLKVLLVWLEELSKQKKNFEKLTADVVLFHSLELLYKIVLDTANSEILISHCEVLKILSFPESSYTCNYLKPKKGSQ
jgi:hypothetical protein